MKSFKQSIIRKSTLLLVPEKDVEKSIDIPIPADGLVNFHRKFYCIVIIRPSVWIKPGDSHATVLLEWEVHLFIVFEHLSMRLSALF